MAPQSSGASSFPSPSPSPCNGSTSSCAAHRCCVYHLVGAGDPSDGIATSYGPSLAQLEQWNPESCGNNLKVGAELCVSGGPSRGAAPSFVSSGPGSTTMNSSIATNASATISPVSSRISSAASPSSCRAKTCCKYYRVASGDTCDGIALKE